MDESRKAFLKEACGWAAGVLLTAGLVSALVLGVGPRDKCSLCGGPACCTLCDGTWPNKCSKRIYLCAECAMPLYKELQEQE